MAKRLPIPKILLTLFPELTLHEIRSLVGVIWKAKKNRVRQAHIFKITLPALGVIRSRGNKRPKRYRSVLKKDRERKRANKLNGKKLP